MVDDDFSFLYILLRVAAKVMFFFAILFIIFASLSPFGWVFWIVTMIASCAWLGYCEQFDKDECDE